MRTENRQVHITEDGTEFALKADAEAHEARGELVNFVYSNLTLDFDNKVEVISFMKAHAGTLVNILTKVSGGQ